MNFLAIVHAACNKFGLKNTLKGPLIPPLKSLSPKKIDLKKIRHLETKKAMAAASSAAVKEILREKEARN
jgi:hypothetical protein